MSKEIEELQRKIEDLLVGRHGADFIESAHYDAESIVSIIEAAGYRKPAPSQKLVGKIREIVCQAIKYGDCCERESSACLRKKHNCRSVEHYTHSIASLLPEMKLIGDEEK